MKRTVAITLVTFWTIILALLIANLLYYQYVKDIDPSNVNDDLIRQALVPIDSSESFVLSTKEIAKHNSQEDCWLIVSDRVYDVTEYVPLHPGGIEEITPVCGKDATEAFKTKGKGNDHSQTAYDLLDKYYLGNLNSVLGSAPPKASPIPIEVAPKPEISSGGVEPILTPGEVAKHSSESDCWVIIYDKVYDITSYLPAHPPGASLITPYCGGDATDAFVNKGDKGKDHKASTYDLLNNYYVGDLNGVITNPSENSGGNQTTQPPAGYPAPSKKKKNNGGDDDYDDD